MQKYQNNVTSRTGDAVSGLQVTVSLAAGGLATVYADNAGTPKDNPITTDANGYFEFYAADGRYNVTVNGGGYEDVLIADALQIGEEATEALAGLAVRPTISELASSSGAAMVGFSQSAAAAPVTNEAQLRAASAAAFSSGSMVDRLEAVCDISQPYIIRRSATEIEVGCSQSPTHGTAFGMRVDADGLLLIRGGFCNVLDPASIPVEADNFVGSFSLNASNPTANYTTVIGASFDLDFDGTGLIFHHYSDDRGGLWHFSVDGGAPIPVSVWAAVGATTATTIVTGLSDGAHTCTATYQGADPAHAPSSGGNGRGWLIRGVTAGFSTGSALISGPPSVRYTGVRPALLSISSIPDFAINVRPASQPAMAGKWVPVHGADTGATRSITRTIVIDGVNVGSDISVIAEYSVALRTLIVRQSYTAYCASDAVGTYPLWTGNITHKYANGVMTVTHSIRYLLDTFSAAGYFSMLPTDSRYANQLVLDSGAELAAELIARTTDLSAPATSALYRKAADGNAVAAETSSLGDALGLRAKSFATGDQFQEERTDNVAKLYWRRYLNTTIPAGTVERYQTRYVLAANNTAVAGL